jgi:outer membrane protein TolC
MKRLVVLTLAIAGLSTHGNTRAEAQLPTPDTLRLDVLQTAAERHDPRLRELAIRESQTALHLRNIAAERLPTIAGSGQAQYQSVVTKFPGSLGRPGQALLHDTYDANVQVTQTVLDPSRSARTAVERAQLARSRADVQTALYTNREQVNESFFSVAALTARH